MRVASSRRPPGAELERSIGTRARWLRAALALAFIVLTGPAIAAGAASAIELGDAVVPLNGPWKFHVGDDPRWADPAFDDSSWEDVDLTAPAGARDDDVGLTGFVPGWAARGHAGYVGYAWYRLGLTVSGAERPLAMDGPFVVDSAYQLYVNGRLVGGVGDFHRAVPAAYGNHRPQWFAIPPDLVRAGGMLVAVRVWLGPWAASDPAGGGMHVAPVIGDRAAVTDRYRLQWLEVFEGYVVDAVEGGLFLLLTVVVLSLAPFDPRNRAYRWMAAALFLLAIVRGNQAVLFWWQFETIPEFELFIITLAVPLSIAAWLMAWNAWFGLKWTPLPRLVGALTAVCIGAQFLSRSWFRGAFPHAVNVLLRDALVYGRLVLLAVFFAIVVRGVRACGREGWFALPAALALGVGAFAQELSAVGIPGIWFPFGVGVSRTEYAYAAFDVALFVLLLHRLWSFRTRQALQL